MPAYLTVMGKRTNRYFATRKAAEEFASELKKSYVRGSKTLVAASRTGEYELKQCRDILQNDETSVLEVVQAVAPWLKIAGGLDVLKCWWQEGHAIVEKRYASKSFREAVDELLRIRSEVQRRRPRTIKQIRTLCRRLMSCDTKMADTSLHEITPAMIKKAFEQSFSTPKQRDDARRVISGVFSLGMKEGWCVENPVSSLIPYVHEEKEIRPLSCEEVKSLLLACDRPTVQVQESSYAGPPCWNLSDCRASVALLVFAGIRPEELTRLHWRDIDLLDKVVSIRSHAAKTGGVRHVSIHDVLYAWLSDCVQASHVPICPVNWKLKWPELRRRAGWNGGKLWPQDVLRHTFASYHAKRYRDFPRLQMEMGHRSSRLLQQRYMNMSGLTETTAEMFWNLKPCVVYA